MAQEKPGGSRGRAATRRGRSAAYALAAVAAVLLTSAIGPSAGAHPGHTGPDFGDGFERGTVWVGDGATVRYVVGGSGPPLVLLHGWPQTSWTWREVMPELAENHTVLAMDLPGLGDSRAPRDGFDKETTAKRIRKAVHRLGFRQVDLLGHDLGALVAYPYAREYPDEVNRVAVLDTPLSGFGLEDFYDISWHFLFNMSPEPIPERILDDHDVAFYHGMLFDGAVHPEAIDREVYFDAYDDRRVREAGYEYYRAFPEDAANNQANADRRLQMPVLAMGAEFAFGPVVAASFSNVADDVREVVAPDSGHFIPEENPEFLAECMELFLGPASGEPSRPELAGCAP